MAAAKHLPYHSNPPIGRLMVLMLPFLNAHQQIYRLFWMNKGEEHERKKGANTYW
jgi:hypothetical protein